jgi:hypothetical protein
MNIPHNLNMMMGGQHQYGRNDRIVVNNIFKQNLNINVNLNINISIPPSPKSTRNNGSRMDTHHSNEEFIREDVGDRLTMRKSLKDFINEVANNNANNEANMSMRYEDLSVIDDEMPIQQKINKNLKPAEYVQGIIE